MFIVGHAPGYTLGRWPQENNSCFVLSFYPHNCNDFIQIARVSYLGVRVQVQYIYIHTYIQISMVRRDIAHNK